MALLFFVQKRASTELPAFFRSGAEGMSDPLGITQIIILCHAKCLNVPSTVFFVYGKTGDMIDNYDPGRPLCSRRECCTF